MAQAPKGDERAGQPPSLLERFYKADQGTVVDPTTVLGGGDREADRQLRLADAGRPSKMTFSLRLTKPSSCRLSICSRRIEGWKVKSKSSSRLMAGRREERMAGDGY